MDNIDRLIHGFDSVLRVLAGVRRAGRASPSDGVAEGELDAPAREHAAALMRVNHVGEVCAQALYQGQAMTARSEANRAALKRAADEELDHLDWSADRIAELGGRTSLLNPFWYGGAFALGATAGAFGDRWNLAFVAETERQVEAHLDGHLAVLDPADRKTRAVVEGMRADEIRHRESALALGAAELPRPVRLGMRVMAKVMTTIARRI